MARDVLGVEPGASASEIASAFRRYAGQHHPDRGGDPARFQEGVDAYRLLVLGLRRPTAERRSAPADVVFHRRSRVRVPSVLHMARRRLSASLRP